MSWWTSIRNAIESVASVAGNVIFPGSGLITSQLVSKGSQEQLGSTLGRLAMMGGGIAGGAMGNMGNYGKLIDTFSGGEGGFGSAPSWYNAGAGAGGVGAQGLDPSLIGNDPIETMYKVSQATGIEDYTAAARALGYNSPAELLNAVNPSWGSPSAGGPGGADAQTQLDAMQRDSLSPDKLGLDTGPLATVKKLMGGTGVMPWGSGGNLMQMGTGLYGLMESRKLQDLAKLYGQQADPFGPYRQQYAQQMSALSANPALLTQQPGYQAGLEAVQRSMAAQGYTGSGNMMAALAKYGGDFYNQTMGMYGNFAGAGANPAAGAQIGFQGAGLGANLAMNSLGMLGKGVTMAGG